MLVGIGGQNNTSYGKHMTGKRPSAAFHENGKGRDQPFFAFVLNQKPSTRFSKVFHLNLDIIGSIQGQRPWIILDYLMSMQGVIIAEDASQRSSSIHYAVLGSSSSTILAMMPAGDGTA